MKTDFASCIYTDLPEDKIYWPEMVIAANSWMEPDLDELVVGETIECWNADGSYFRTVHTITDDDVHQFRKLVADKIAHRLYASEAGNLRMLSDVELEALMIARGYAI